MRYFVGLTFVLVLVTAARGETAALEGAFEGASRHLQAATVTVRVIPPQTKINEDAPMPEDDGAAAKGAAGDEEHNVQPPAKQVTVCSGASVGQGLVVTYAEISAQDEVRITIPGGEQAKAKLKVLDHVSGLTLLETDKKDMPSFSTAAKIPNVGAWVLAGAGWGAEKPVVSFGILAGANRNMRGATFPPLLQCDLRTADTSNGAPLVNQEGELIGIVVASGAVGNESRWTYAVPVKHVQRMVRALDPDQIIQIPNVRPVVGMRLDLGDTPDTVVVGRVFQGGPAEKAGVREGDRVITAEGMKIRNPYQVVGPLLAKQPGDTLTFTVRQGDKERELEIVLGGGTVLPPNPRIESLTRFKPAGRLQVYRDLASVGGAPTGDIRIQHSNDVDASADTRAVAEEIDKLKLQRDAIRTYLSALQRMKDQIAERDKALAQRDAQIEALQKQVQALQEAVRP